MSNTELTMSPLEETADLAPIDEHDALLIDLAHPLAAEIRFYRTHRAELLDNAENRYVVIKDGILIGPFDTEDEALDQGLLAFGGVPMLVQQITKEDIPVRIG